MAEVGVNISGYEILEPLDEHGAHPVFRARHQATGKLCALKLYREPFPIGDPSTFEQVMKRASRIRDVHVVAPLEWGTFEDGGWAAMPFVEGETLAAAIEEHGRSPRAPALERVLDVAAAMRAAAAAGLDHPTFWPGYVLVAEPEGFARVWDFGIASWEFAAEKAAGGGYLSGGGSKPFWYMTEETATGRPPTSASAVSLLGQLAFHLFTGKPYWLNAGGGSPLPLVKEVLASPKELASARAERLDVPPPPEGFDDWFSQCVDKVGPAFGGIDEATAALEDVLIPTESEQVIAATHERLVQEINSTRGDARCAAVIRREVENLVPSAYHRARALIRDAEERLATLIGDDDDLRSLREQAAAAFKRLRARNAPRAAELRAKLAEVNRELQEMDRISEHSRSATEVQLAYKKTQARRDCLKIALADAEGPGLRLVR